MSGELLCMDAVAVAGVLLLLGLGWTPEAGAAGVQSRYYAYPAVEDADSVIAPWYKGQNGQWDFRVRIAAETMKRYPWTTRERGPVPAPEYMVNGSWTITPEGEISVPDLASWDNGDFGQRAAYVLAGWVDYYRYSGDPAALAHMAMQADLLLDYCQTPRTVSISINGEEKVCDMDIQATAGGQAKAVDLVFNDVMPSHGIIEVRLWNNHDGEAVLQALEVGSGDGGTGAVPITWTPPA